MAFTHGSKASFQVDDTTATLRDLSSYLKSAGLARSADTAETSALGTTSKTYIPGLLDATISIEGQFDPTVDGYLSGLLGFATPVDFEYYPAGTPVGATKPKFTGTVILTSYEVTSGVDDVAMISGEFQVSGAVTRAVA